MIPLSRCLYKYNSVRLGIRRCTNVFNQFTTDDRTKDELLLRTRDFCGVTSRQNKQNNISPETHFAYLKQVMKLSGRISCNSLFEKILQPLEQDEKKILNILKNDSERWLPVIVLACGNAMSNTHRFTREIIFDRLWSQIEKKDIPISIQSYNNRLKVFIENGTAFSVKDEMAYLTEKIKLEPNQETFQHYLERLAQQGDIDGCRHMVYKMAANGCVVDYLCNQSLVYCFALRGHHAKADSLVEQSKSKYDFKAMEIANGACAKAAAVRGDTARLRQILRRTRRYDKKLGIPSTQLFETIWLLAENSKNSSGSQYSVLVEQILNSMSHSKGFFHLLVREIERHIAHDNFYTAICLLEDIKRVSDCLRNQHRSKVMEQLLSRLSHQLIRNQVPLQQVLEISYRIVALFKKEPVGPRFMDNLLNAALMYKDLTIDQRIEYLSAFVDSVDRTRERPHIILPLLVSSKDIDERLKVLFRCSVLGYNNLSELDINEIVRLLLAPLHETVRPARRENKVEKISKILKSFGVTPEVTWKLYHGWYLLKKREENSVDPEQVTKPGSGVLLKWLQDSYSSVFGQKQFNGFSNLKIKPTYDRLKFIIIEERDATKAASFINKYGWPDDTNYAEISAKLVELLLDVEDWPTVTRILASLSAQSEEWSKKNSENFSPLKNNHLLAILRRLAQEGDALSIRKLIEFSYELKGMFPNAVVHYDTFFDTLYEYNRLFHKLFDRLTDLDVVKVDECMELLRTLIKLDILSLHVNETLTTVFVNNVIKKIGLEEGVNTWMKFQSSLSCSNAIVALIRYCLIRNDDLSNKRIQYILHKAQNFTSQSRVHTLYCAVLVSSRRYDDAVKYISLQKDFISPMDCVTSFKLLNALKFKRLDEEFVYNFIDLFLTHTNIAEDKETVTALQHELLRICQIHDAGPLSLKIYQRFLEAGIDLGADEKKKLWEIVGRHEEFARKWLYMPNGMLRLSEDDPISKERDTFKIQTKLREDIEKLKAAN